MTHAALGILCAIIGALVMYIVGIKQKTPTTKPPEPKPSKPVEIDYEQTLEEITNESTPPPINTDHLSDADWWRRHSAGEGDDG